jgi:hypothetical protein
MRLIIFKSEANSELRAFASDPGGRQLPSKFAPWHAIGVVAADREPPHKLNRDLIERAIADQGYQLFRFKPKS